MDNKRYLNIYIVLSSLLLLTVLHLILNINLESYEKIFSALVNGTYTDFAIKDYDTDVHFLFFSLYSLLNSYFPSVQIYGYILVFLNIISLTLFGYVIHKILGEQQSKFYLFILYPILFTAASSYHVVSLSATRMALLLCGSTLYLLYFNEVKTKRSSVFIGLTFIFFTLLRIDAVVIACFLFLLITVYINRKITFQQFIPFLASILVLISFNIMMSNSDREAKQIYYFKELDIFDRDNIDFNRITELDSTYISLLKYHYIFDQQHFELDYINSLLKTNTNNLTNSIVNLKLFQTTLKKSWPEIFKARGLIFLCFLLMVYNIYATRQRVKYTFLFIGLLIFPFALCLYVLLPLRFIEPYYVFLLIFLLKPFVTKSYSIVPILAFAIITILVIGKSNRANRIEQDAFKNTYTYLMEERNNNQVIVIENIVSGTFFSPSPFFKLTNTNATFLNYGVFNSYECYQDYWREMCQCNPLSLVEKLEYVAANNLPFIINEQRIPIYEEALKLVWNKEISFERVKTINANLSSYNISLKK